MQNNLVIYVILVVLLQTCKKLIIQYLNVLFTYFYKYFYFVTVSSLRVCYKMCKSAENLCVRV